MNKHARLLTMLALWLLAAAAHAGTVTYVYTDPQGTPLAEADAQGNITARFEYTPYGVSVPSMGAPPNGVGYTGHVNDPETGLVYMQARYYDAEVGRFLSVDPLAVHEKPGKNFNRYWYANNNPNRFTDPDGRESVGETIDRRAMESANAGDNAGTYGWAFAGVAWSVFGAEGLSQSYDKGSSAGAGNNAMAVLEVVTLGKGSIVARGTKWVGAAGKDVISFGKNANQISHAFRHAVDAGLSLRNVASRVVRDLNKVAGSLEAGKTVNRAINVDGKALEYAVHKLEDGTLRVGRIKVLKEQ